MKLRTEAVWYIGLGVRMDLSCRDFTESALTWNEGKNPALGRVVASERSFGTELWNGALELWKQSFGTEETKLWNGGNKALERRKQSFGTEETKLWNGGNKALERRK